jgi:hypothetical protein
MFFTFDVEILNRHAMKKLILFLAFGILYLNTFSNPIIPADTLRIEGKLALLLMTGNHYGDGFCYGDLLGGRIMNLFEHYVIPSAFGGATNYNYARQLFDQYFVVDDKYVEIAQGMIEGIEQSGVSLFSQVLNDNIGYKDVLIANSIPDFSSFDKAWNNMGPELSGETVISRNLDWTNNPYLINNALIIIWAPCGPNEQRWISFGFIGLFGALSGFNESGVASFQNMGNYNSTPVGTGFYPVNLAQRNGLEMNDYNGDGICSPRDVSDAVRDHPVSSTYIIHSAGKSYLDIPAEILEIHNAFGDTIRTVNDNPEFFGDNLVATNHFRLLKPSTYCARYQRISDSLSKSNLMSVQRNWDVLSTAGVSTNLQTIQYTPGKHILRFSFAEVGIPAYQIEPSEVWVDSLFMLVGINDFQKNSLLEMFVSPNPCKNFTTITARFESPASFACRITDITGKLIEDFNNFNLNENITTIGWGTSDVPNGIYFCIIEFNDPATGSPIKETRKIVVSK